MMRDTMKANIQHLFFALNSKIELIPKPLNLLDLGWDCLSIIGDMVKTENRKIWKSEYYDNYKEKYGFVTIWSMYENMIDDCVRMSVKHPYNVPITIRNYCPVWGYRTEAVVVGKRWLDIWQACDAVVRNARVKNDHWASGSPDHHIYIERLVQPGPTFEKYGYVIEEFLSEDDPEYRIDGDYDESIWYLRTGS